MEVKQRSPIALASSGSVKLPIYYSPLRKKLKGKSDGPGAERVLASGRKVYDSWIFYFYEGGCRLKRRFNELAKAKKEGDSQAEKLAKPGNEGIVLPQSESRVYINAKTILARHGMEVDAAARLLDDLLTQLQGNSLTHAVNFFCAHARQTKLVKSPQESYEAYLQDLEQRHVSKYHLRDVRRFVGR